MGLSGIAIAFAITLSGLSTGRAIAGVPPSLRAIAALAAPASPAHHAMRSRGTGLILVSQDGRQADAAKPKRAPEKPFSRLLREAFGNFHDQVENTTFNQTLFAGKLTREQLEAHLQQRALIHNEVHRILIAAARQTAMPYGPEQKHVLVLLFSDLIAMGSGWPTEAQALPRTREFLREIRESEKQGPYFALGVQHVYYGGITNGGRIIGKKIGETLQVEPTYYEQSDGYLAYIAEVNKISDPAARREMIRGGRAAYRYIIAVADLDMFKPK